MPIPNFQTLMLPLLKLASDRLEHSFKDAIPFLAEKFDLTENEKKELLPNGKQSKFNKRVYLTKTHLFKAGLLDSDRRGAFRITEEGLRVLATNPPPIDTNFLEQYDTYRAFRTPASKKGKYVLTKAASANNLTIAHTAIEKDLENVYQQLQAALSIEVLEAIKQCSLGCFRSFVIDTLVSMGYGAQTEVSQALRGSADETINGIIVANRLDLDTIYVRATQQEHKVTKSEIYQFTEVLVERNIQQGIFIATSNFSQSAIDHITCIESKILLINGRELAELAIAHNIGVTLKSKYEIKQVSCNYFKRD